MKYILIIIVKKGENYMAFFKKPTEADKVAKEIEATMFRKNSMVSVIQNERVALENSRFQIFKDLGEYVYEQHLKGDTTLDFNNYFNEIKRTSEEIKQKADKEIEISARYDEEVDILNSKLAMLGTPVNNTKPNVNTNVNINSQDKAMPVINQTQVVQETPQTVVQQAPEVQVLTEVVQTLEVSNKICDKCQKPVDEGDMFCQECGNKLQ